MATPQFHRFVDHIRKTILVHDAVDVSDGLLLERFITRREEAAFELLMHRHGPMVLGVCQRMVGNDHDAEDAFQATFLVLARKASSIKPRQMVGNWLYGVAYQMALKARSVIAKRRLREKPMIVMPEPLAPVADSWSELQQLLDRELARLSDKYRLPIVLCDLEGRPAKEVAQQLGLPEGTLSSRLSRGRKMLAKRLARHGLTLSTAALAGLMAQNGAAAHVDSLLASSTVRVAGAFAAGQPAKGLVSASVAFLAEGALKAMLLKKLTMTTLFAIFGMFTFGGGLLAQYLTTEQPINAEPNVENRVRAPRTSTEEPPPSVAQAPTPVAPAQPKARVDLFGDPLPPGALVRMGTVRFHAKEVGSLAYSPDGKILATGGTASSQLWEVATGKVIHTLKHDDGGNQPGALTLAFSPDGKILATGHWHQVRLWDVATGKATHTYRAFGASALAFSPDGKTLAYPWGTAIVQIETATGKELPSLEVLPKKPGGQIRSLAFSPDGKTLATGSTDKLIRLLEFPSGKEIRTIEGHTVAVVALAFSPDGKTLAATSGGFDNTVRLWEPATGKELKKIVDVPMGARGGDVRLAYCPDGKSLGVGNVLMNAATGEIIRSIPSYFAFAPDGKTMAVSGVRVLDVATGKQTLPDPVDDPASAVMAVAFSPDGKTLASTDGRIRLWDAGTGKKLRAFTENSGGQSLTYSSDGKTLIMDGGLWDVDTGKEIRQRDNGHWSPNGQYRARASAKSVKVWDAAGKEMHDLTVKEPHTFSALAFSPDGKILAAGYRCSAPRGTADLRPEDQMWKIQLWEAANGKEMGNIFAETKELRGISFLAFSPDGKMLASANANGMVRLWDPASGKEIRYFETGKDVLGAFARAGGKCTVVFSSDGKLLATLTSGLAVSVVRLWDLGTGKEIHNIKGQGFQCMAFAPNGRTLATGNADTTCTIWEIPTAKGDR